MLRLGGPVYIDPGQESYHAVVRDEKTLELLISKLKEKGYKAAYAPLIDLEDQALIEKTRAAFAEADITIAELGYWHNMMNQNPEERAAVRDAMVQHIRLADALGCTCTATILGCHVKGDNHRNYCAANFSEEALNDAVELARYLIDQANPSHTVLTFEIHQFNALDSIENIEWLEKKVGRKHFAVHMDLANLVNCPRNYFKSRELLKEAIDRFGDKIVSCHVKDLSMRRDTDNVILEEVMLGAGGIDVQGCMQELDALSTKQGRDLPYMMEHRYSEAEYDVQAAYLRKLAEEVGISL